VFSAILLHVFSLERGHLRLHQAVFGFVGVSAAIGLREERSVRPPLYVQGASTVWMCSTVNFSPQMPPSLKGFTLGKHSPDSRPAFGHDSVGREYSTSDGSCARMRFQSQALIAAMCSFTTSSGSPAFAMPAMAFAARRPRTPAQVPRTSKEQNIES